MRHPSNLKGVGKFWAINPTKDGELPDLTKDPGYSGRAQYLEGQKQTFSLRLERVTERDEHLYCLKITSDSEKQRYLGYPGVRLRVTDPPKNVLVAITPPGEIMEGSSVTLTCNSDENPPADEYHWFRGKQLVGKGKDYTISNYSSQDGGEYKCKSSNAEGSNYSAGVALNVVSSLSAYTIVLYVAAVAALCGLAGLLSVVIWHMRQKKKRDEHDYQNVGPNATDDTYTALQTTARSSDDVYHTLAVRVPAQNS
ncbi:hypothetical protein NFI96_001618 [Prochilodus magdalenae]|nr:hypothetical protein NFI96_001618 [Prochilodus magdalenae]